MPTTSREVEAGKTAATAIIALKAQLSVAALRAAPGSALTAEALAQKVGGDAELSYKILEHLAANGAVRKHARSPWFESTIRGRERLKRQAPDATRNNEISGQENQPSLQTSVARPPDGHLSVGPMAVR